MNRLGRRQAVVGVVAVAALVVLAVVGGAPVAGAHGPRPHKREGERSRFEKAPGQDGQPTDRSERSADEPDDLTDEKKRDETYNTPSMRLDTKVMMQRLDPARDTALEMAEINNQLTPAYSTADCTSGEVPVVCCKYDPADKGSDCGVFKMICEEWGWQSEGTPIEARCSAP